VRVPLRVSNTCQLITWIREPPLSDVNFVTARLFSVQRAAWLTPIQWNGRSDSSWNFIGTSEWEIFRWNVETKRALIEQRIKIDHWIGAREPFDSSLPQKCLNYMPKKYISVFQLTEFSIWRCVIIRVKNIGLGCFSNLWSINMS
jgi:hypothetical protein